MLSDDQGKLAALGAAVAWAIGSVLFSRIPAPARALNLFKNGFGALVLLGFLALRAWQGGGVVLHPDAGAWFYLALSALVGLFVGDTFYFRSLQILGPRRSSVLSTLTPPFSVLIGWIVLAEALPASVWLGIAVLLAGVVTVLTERGGGREAPGFYPGAAWLGVLFGAGGSLCQAAGAALSKLGMPPGSDAIEASFVRLSAAALLGSATGAWRRELFPWCMHMIAAGWWRRLIPASLIGTCIGISLSLVAFQYTQVAVATTLTSMTPIFALPVVWILLGQHISARAILGAAVAVGGVALLFAA